MKAFGYERKTIEYVGKLCSFPQGLLTGSVYKDYALLKNGFPAESIVNGSVIAIKTHEFGPESIAGYDRVILLVRNPFASLQVIELDIYIGANIKIVIHVVQFKSYDNHSNVKC